MFILGTKLFITIALLRVFIWYERLPSSISNIVSSNKLYFIRRYFMMYFLNTNLSCSNITTLSIKELNITSHYIIIISIIVDEYGHCILLHHIASQLHHITSRKAISTTSISIIYNKQNYISLHHMSYCITKDYLDYIINNILQYISTTSHYIIWHHNIWHHNDHIPQFLNLSFLPKQVL